VRQFVPDTSRTKIDRERARDPTKRLDIHTNWRCCTGSQRWYSPSRADLNLPPHIADQTPHHGHGELFRSVGEFVCIRRMHKLARGVQWVETAGNNGPNEREAPTCSLAGFLSGEEGVQWKNTALNRVRPDFGWSSGYQAAATVTRTAASITELVARRWVDLGSDEVHAGCDDVFDFRLTFS
jgi:hypothetical protein